MFDYPTVDTSCNGRSSSCPGQFERDPDTSSVSQALSTHETCMTCCPCRNYSEILHVAADLAEDLGLTAQCDRKSQEVLSGSTPFRSGLEEVSPPPSLATSSVFSSLWSSSTSGRRKKSPRTGSSVPTGTSPPVGCSPRKSFCSSIDQPSLPQGGLRKCRSFIFEDFLLQPTDSFQVSGTNNNSRRTLLDEFSFTVQPHHALPSTGLFLGTDRNGTMCSCVCHASTLRYEAKEFLHRGFTSTVMVLCRVLHSARLPQQQKRGLESSSEPVWDGPKVVSPETPTTSPGNIWSDQKAHQWLSKIQDLEEIVIKVIHKSNCNREELENCVRESRLLASTAHKNIVQLLAYLDCWDELWMIFERAPYADLGDNTSGRSLEESEVKYIVRQILQALRYCHHRRILHGDVKPKNVLVYGRSPPLKPLEKSISAGTGTISYTPPREFVASWKEARLKLADFGLAEDLSQGRDFVKFNGVRGSHGYFAPEILLRRDYDYKVDVWAVGIITFTLLVGYEPFYPPSTCITETVQFNPRYWACKSQESQNFCGRLLEFDPSKRMSAGDALAHPWLAS